MSKKVKPDKKEVAQYIALNGLGLSPSAIAKRMGKSHHTVIKYLNSDVYRDDPLVKELVSTIKEKETADLCLLGGKARARLHEILDEGNTKAIETVAIMDRSFQQRRLLEGLSTANIDYASIRKERTDIEARIKELEIELGIREPQEIEAEYKVEKS